MAVTGTNERSLHELALRENGVYGYRWLCAISHVAVLADIHHALIYGSGGESGYMRKNMDENFRASGSFSMQKFGHRFENDFWQPVWLRSDDHARTGCCEITPESQIAGYVARNCSMGYMRGLRSV